MDYPANNPNIDYDREALEDWPIATMTEWHPSFHLVCPMFDDVFDLLRLITHNYKAILEENGEPKEFLLFHMKEEVTVWLAHWFEEIIDSVWSEASSLESESEASSLYPSIPFSNSDS